MKMKTLCSTLAIIALASGPVHAQPEDDFGDDTFEDEGFEEEGDFGADDFEGEDLDEEEAEADVEAEAETDGADGTRSLGWGATRTLSGVVGPELEFHVSEKLLVTAMLGISFVSPEMGDSTTTLGLGGAGFYEIAGGGPVELMFGGRLLLGTRSGGESGSQINIEIPARVQWYVSDLFALHMETGAVIALIPEEGAVMGPRLGAADGTNIVIGAGGLFGSAGITVYWP